MDFPRILLPGCECADVISSVKQRLSNRKNHSYGGGSPRSGMVRSSFMARSFTFSTGGRDPTAVVNKARQAAIVNSAAFSGDEKTGSFSGGKFRGTYRLEGETVIVTITDKPWAVPWFVVESKLREFFQ